MNADFEPTTPRAGRLMQQPAGYRAFIPSPLPPQPPLTIDGEMLKLLSDADQHLARLDALSTLLPNPDLFVAMYVKHEAVLSSQIEGTQSTLDDILALEAHTHQASAPPDAGEVVNYVRAMNYGIARIERDDFPLSLRLIREVHGELMQGVRGQEKSPGEFRTSQNWIGGASPARAAFVPPPAHEVMPALDALEKFIHYARADTPTLIHCALAHAQFETIHPFLDGNGRVGRLLITLMLVEAKVLSRPLLYLSLYLKSNRSEYYERLMNIRFRGEWEAWVKFFLKGIAQTAKAATNTGREILALREAHRAAFAHSPNAQTLIDHLFLQPYLTVQHAQKLMDCTAPTAGKIVSELEAHGVLQETTGKKRNRVYRYAPLIALFDTNP
jgi:Fic family protein